MTKDLFSNTSIDNSASDIEDQDDNDIDEELFDFEDFDSEESGTEESEPDLDNDESSEILDLTSREYHNKKLNEIYESVKSSQKKILSLLYTLWRDDAYNKIIKILKEHPSFAKIKLGGTPIKDSSAYNLADLIATNDRIKYIDIEACELIGSEGLIAIFKSLSKNTTLEVLAIDRVGIDQVVCEELIDQLKTNFTLKSLQNLTRDGVGEIYLDQNNISKDLNNKIRSLLTRNNELSDAQKKFYYIFKNDLVRELTKIYPSDPQDQQLNSLRVKEVMTFAMDKILNQETFNEIKKLFQIAKKPVLSSKDRTSETSVSLGDDLSLKILSRAIKNLIKDQNFKISELELETVGNVIFNVFTKKQHKIIDGTRLRPSGSQKLQSASQTR